MKTTIIVALAAGLLATSASAEPLTSRSRSFYDSRGHFAGSATTRGDNTSVYDSRGHFSGSIIRNRDGTTSHYDRAGRFIGSSSKTTSTFPAQPLSSPLSPHDGRRRLYF